MSLWAVSAVFGGVPKMLTGKMFPQNVRTMRMVAEAILRQIMQSTPVTCKEELMKVLEDLAGRCTTTKLWVDMLIKPVFIMMMYIRTEREEDWLLHLEVFILMMPYIFAASHVHYAQYGLFYIQNQNQNQFIIGNFSVGLYIQSR